ncbi:MAG: hypothetical protein OXF07_15325 [Rhodobacter sp.]|nr:hypothetical protein [Rhodobacter sp.]
MKAIWAGLAGVVVIAAAANFVLGSLAFSSAERGSGSAVRLETSN